MLSACVTSSCRSMFSGHDTLSSLMQVSSISRNGSPLACFAASVLTLSPLTSISLVTVISPDQHNRSLSLATHIGWPLCMLAGSTHRKSAPTKQMKFSPPTSGYCPYSLAEPAKTEYGSVSALMSGTAFPLTTTERSAIPHLGDEEPRTRPTNDLCLFGYTIAKLLSPAKGNRKSNLVFSADGWSHYDEVVEMLQTQHDVL